MSALHLYVVWKFAKIPIFQIIPSQNYGGLSKKEIEEQEKRAEEFAKTAIERLKK